MTNEIKGLFVNYINGTIEVTTNFLAKAGKMGTPEQKAMVAIRKELPEYKIDVKEPEKKKESYEKLTVERMLAYVELNGESGAVEKFNRDVLVYVDEKTNKLEKGKYATVKRIFLVSYGESYTKLYKEEDSESKLEKITRLDEKEKAIKKAAEGKIGNYLNSTSDKKNNVIEMSAVMEKVVNE